MEVILVPLLLLLKSVLNIIVIVVFTDVIMSWLVAANVVNINNRFVYSLMDVCDRISGFLLNPIRSRFPTNLGSIDISPIILILLLTFAEDVITRLALKLS